MNLDDFLLDEKQISCKFEDKAKTKKFGKNGWKYCSLGRSLLLCDPGKCTLKKFGEKRE